MSPAGRRAEPSRTEQEEETSVEMISMAEAARKLRVSRQMVWAWVKAGKVPGARREPTVGSRGDVYERWVVPAGIERPPAPEKQIRKHVRKENPEPVDMVQVVWEAQGKKSVRQLAEELDMAPGMVMRLYEAGLRRYAS